MCKYAISAICISRMAGMPYLNFLCTFYGARLSFPSMPPKYSQQQKRGFRNAPLGFLSFVFVNAVHDECNCIDGKEIVGKITM